MTMNKLHYPTPFQTILIYLFCKISDYCRCWECITNDQLVNMPQKHIFLDCIACLTVFHGCFMV